MSLFTVTVRTERSLRGDRSSRKRLSRRIMRARVVAGAIGCLVYLALFLPTAFADPEFLFDPKLEGLEVSSPQAGAHPDLILKITQPSPECISKTPGPFPKCIQHVLQQNLKRITLDLPAGFLGDVNAAPYCSAARIPADNQFLDEIWACGNEDARVGTVVLLVYACDTAIFKDSGEDACFSGGDLHKAFGDPFLPLPPGPPPAMFHFPGTVYNEKPEPGEQAHFVIIWPTNKDLYLQALGEETASQLPIEQFGGWVRSDIGVTVGGPDLRVKAVADDIPDLIETQTDQHAPGQLASLTMTLDGETGGGTGHPFLTNALYCDPQSFGVALTGYAFNSHFLTPTEFASAQGDGKTVNFSVPYQATGCEQVPYDPMLSMNLESQGPDQVPVITSTVTQQDGEATTDSVRVSFPSTFKINPNNKATHCPAADLAAKSCPGTSRIGAVTAESRLLPIGQKLEGNVYLAGLTSDSVKLSALLSGFIDLRIDAQGKIDSDGSITTTFDDLPPVPISKFDLSLEGGEKGLLKTPKVCAPQKVPAVFKSHSGRVKVNTQPVDIQGCANPELDVELSSRKPGRAIDLDLTIGSPGTRIADVELHLARQLKWGERKPAATDKRLKSVGTASFVTSGGTQNIPLAAQRTQRGNVTFSEIRPKAASGQLQAAAIPGLSATLFRTAERQPTLLGKAKKKARAPGVRQSDLTFGGLPKDALTRIELSLRGESKRRRIFLKNPRGCKKLLNFVAIVTATDGRRFALKDQVKLKGGGCR